MMTLPPAFSISVQAADFDLGDELSRLHEAAGQQATGAIASFVGHVRAGEGETQLRALELEHYPGMTEKALTEIVQHAAGRWPLLAARVIHRHGRLESGARIVLVAIASVHRGDAFAACEFVMDFLKTRAPFWKREERVDGGGQWVEARSSDDEAAARWQQD